VLPLVPGAQRQPGVKTQQRVHAAAGRGAADEADTGSGADGVECCGQQVRRLQATCVNCCFCCPPPMRCCGPPPGEPQDALL
jgi:hypothetical protein